MKYYALIITLILAGCATQPGSLLVTPTATDTAPVSNEAPAPTATAPATIAPAAFPTVCTGVVVAQTALNLRREPDLSAELVDPAVYLLAGDTVTLHFRDGDWWRVTYSPKGDNPATTNGWANAAYIQEMGCK